MDKKIDIDKLKELLESGTPIKEAFNQLGHENFSNAISQLGELATKSNTRSCSLAEQYCGCVPR
jgi:hypothetical protein